MGMPRLLANGWGATRVAVPGMALATVAIGMALRSGRKNDRNGARGNQSLELFLPMSARRDRIEVPRDVADRLPASPVTIPDYPLPIL
jgi:hypothetical protein